MPRTTDGYHFGAPPPPEDPQTPRVVFAHTISTRSSSPKSEANEESSERPLMVLLYHIRVLKALDG